MNRLMRFLGRTSTIVVLAALATVAMGAGAWLWGGKSEGRQRVASNYVAAAPAKTKAVGLAVVMGESGDVSAVGATDEASSTAPATDAETPVAADGASGADGLPGADGAAGADGPAGVDGAEGPQGSVGATGPAGSVGATGPAGSDGATGPAGSMGATGPAGVGLTPSIQGGGGFEWVSPDGVSYRIRVTNGGIFFVGPTTSELWSDTSHFQTLVP